MTSEISKDDAHHVFWEKGDPRPKPSEAERRMLQGKPPSQSKGFTVDQEKLKAAQAAREATNRLLGREDSAEGSGRSTIRAAGIIFVCGDKALFLQRSAEGDQPGTWSYPGGKIEDGESAEEAARRECVEEIGQMPKGALAIHARRISTVINDDAESEAALAPSIVAEPAVDFTTFVCRVKAEFEPKLNDEHTGWAWAPITSPPQPMHPGAAAALAKFTMNEYDVAVEIMNGELTSPQQFMDNMWLFDMRITGTGMSFRSAHNEFVMRDPSLYLNDYFLARCNGLEVIVEHPPDQTLDTDEYRDRVVGSIILPYIKGDEVWGIAKIRDAACAAMLTDPERKDEYSTSPAVVFRKHDGNTQHLVDGKTVLVEGSPSLLDHLAICRAGVWDKGGEPNGIVSTRGDSIVAEKDDKKEDSKKADANSDMMSMMDAFRADMKECMSRMDDYESSLKKIGNNPFGGETKKEEPKKATSTGKKKAKKADSDDDDDKADSDDDEKADSDDDDDRSDADEPNDGDGDRDADKAGHKKADAKKKADSKKKADGDDDMDRKEDSARADASEKLIKSMQEQIAALSAKMPAVMADSDRAPFAAAQMRADVAYTAHGQSAPGPLQGETLIAYRKRLAAGQKGHSSRAKDIDIMAIGDEATIGVFEDMIYTDSVKASSDPTTVPFGQLRARKRKDSTGMREITEYDGDPASWMSGFASRTMAVSKIRTPGSLN